MKCLYPVLHCPSLSPVTLAVVQVNNKGFTKHELERKIINSFEYNSEPEEAPQLYPITRL